MVVSRFSFKAIMGYMAIMALKGNKNIMPDLGASYAMAVSRFTLNAITGFIASMARNGKLQYHAGLGAISKPVVVSMFSFNGMVDI